MPRPRSTLPGYRLHRQSGQAIVTVALVGGGRRDILLGKHNTPESKVEYRQICGLLLENGGFYPTGAGDVTVAEVLLKYVQHAMKYYGEGSSLNQVRRPLRTVKTLYATTLASDFGSKALKACQAHWVKEGFTRRSINKMTGTVKRAWRWLVAEELVPAECHLRLQAVEGLRQGRTAARDNPPVRPANSADVKAALPHMPPTVAAVVRLQVLTGARCGELLSMKAAEVDRTGEVWRFNPTVHKGTWRGKFRSIPIGPESQRLLEPYLLKAGDEFVFSPARSEEDRNADRSAERKTKRWPSHMRRNATKRVSDREGAPGARYSTNTLRRAVVRACDAAGVSRFTPHQLRHLAAHEIREKFGLEHCRASLGHTVASMSEHYSREVDHRLAAEVALAVG